MKIEETRIHCEAHADKDIVRAPRSHASAYPGAPEMGLNK